MKKVNTAGKDRKERNTPQRAALARLLAGNRSHPSAEALHKKLAGASPACRWPRSTTTCGGSSPPGNWPS
ncbi:MAG TPA: hypothetical protein PKK31_05585 [Elusimicrobiales bacterium]|nr:hypothetical protein [Elusimicrobiales bacterium]